MKKWIMFKFIDKMLDKTPAKGWRTIIAGYAATTLPAVVEIASSDLQGAEFWYKLAIAAGGPAVHYFRSKA